LKKNSKTNENLRKMTKVKRKVNRVRERETDWDTLKTDCGEKINVKE
jgi:hypothetical protein